MVAVSTHRHTHTKGTPRIDNNIENQVNEDGRANLSGESGMWWEYTDGDGIVRACE